MALHDQCVRLEKCVVVDMCMCGKRGKHTTHVSYYSGVCLLMSLDLVPRQPGSRKWYWFVLWTHTGIRRCARSLQACVRPWLLTETPYPTCKLWRKGRLSLLARTTTSHCRAREWAFSLFHYGHQVKPLWLTICWCVNRTDRVKLGIANTRYGLFWKDIRRSLLMSRCHDDTWISDRVCVCLIVGRLSKNKC